MHLSDIALACAAECLDLAQTINCPKTANALIAIACRLSDAATDDAAICIDGEDLAPSPGGRPPRTRH